MTFAYLAEYAAFESVENMDSNIKKHMSKYRFELTESERDVLFMIAGRSLMYPGASHLKAETIADKIKKSRSTITRSIKKLCDLLIIKKVNKTKLNGIKGANIFSILPFDEPSEMNHRDIVGNANNINGLKAVSEDVSTLSFNLLSSKQAKNIMSLENDLALQAEKKKEYMNDYQVKLFDFLHSLPLVDELKDQLHNIVLATEINTVQSFHQVKNVFMNVATDINEGTLTVSSTLRAVFKGAYDKACKYDVVNAKSIVEDKERIVPAFYNWLDDREGSSVNKNVSNPNLPNWLEW